MNDPTRKFDSIYRDIYKNYLLTGFWLSIFLNCTCINSIVLFATGKWMLNLGNGNNVHDPDFVFKFWTISTLVIVALAGAAAVWKCRRFKRLYKQATSGELKTIPYLEIDAPSLGVMEGEDNFIYGKALGLHIKNKLAIHNYSVPDPVPEEYRWCVFAERDGFRMEISVFGHLKDDFYESEVEDHDGDLRIPAGTPLELWIRVRTHPRSYWSWSQFRSVDRSQQVFELHESILRVLESDPQITVLRCCDELPDEEDLVSD